MKVVGRMSLVGVVATLALFVGVSSASAGVVSYFGGCYQGGPLTTTGDVQLRAGWATSDYGLTKKFLELQSVTLTVNGVTTTTAVGSSTGWGPITQTVNGDGATIYVSFWTSPVLATSGQTVTTSLVFNTAKKIWDDANTSYKAGPLWNPPGGCTITAT